MKSIIILHSHDSISQYGLIEDWKSVPLAYIKKYTAQYSAHAQ